MPWYKSSFQSVGCINTKFPGNSYCYERMRINNKKIRTHRFMWKTLNKKNHQQKRRKSTISKIGTKGKIIKKLLHRHKHHNLKSYIPSHLYIYIYMCVCVCVCVCVRERERERERDREKEKNK